MLASTISLTVLELPCCSFPFLFLSQLLFLLAFFPFFSSSCLPSSSLLHLLFLLLLLLFLLISHLCSCFRPFLLLSPSFNPTPSSALLSSPMAILIHSSCFPSFIHVLLLLFSLLLYLLILFTPSPSSALPSSPQPFLYSTPEKCMLLKLKETCCNAHNTQLHTMDDE